MLPSSAQNLQASKVLLSKRCVCNDWGGSQPLATHPIREITLWTKAKEKSRKIPNPVRLSAAPELPTSDSNLVSPAHSFCHSTNMRVLSAQGSRDMATRGEEGSQSMRTPLLSYPWRVLGWRGRRLGWRDTRWGQQKAGPPGQYSS